MDEILRTFLGTFSLTFDPVDTKVIEVADFKYEVPICHWGFYQSRTLVYKAIAL